MESGFFGHLTFEQIGMALVAVALIVKGGLDAYAKRWVAMREPPPLPPLAPPPDPGCQFTEDDRRKLNALFNLYANGRAIDPVDGNPRAFSRDLMRDGLKLLRDIQGALARHDARTERD